MNILPIDILFEQGRNVGKNVIEIPIGDSEFAVFEITHRWHYSQRKIVPKLIYNNKGGNGNTIIPAYIPAMVDILCKLYPEYKQDIIDKLSERR